MRPRRSDFTDRVITQIDKDRRTAAQKARDAKVTADAYTAAQRRLLGVPDELLDLHADGELDAIRDVLTARRGAVPASSKLAAKAEQAIILGPNRRAIADQQLAKLTRADNDRGTDD
jgi:predicted deacylase